MIYVISLDIAELNWRDISRVVVLVCIYESSVKGDFL